MLVGWVAEGVVFGNGAVVVDGPAWETVLALRCGGAPLPGPRPG